MRHEVSWWIQGGSYLRTEVGTDLVEFDGELSVEEAEEILEASLKDFSTTFANEHYLIECGVWDFGVTGVDLDERVVIEQPKPQKPKVTIHREVDWVKEWDRKAHYMHKTGMSKSYLKREMICPDCGGELWKSQAVHPDHIIYHCYGCTIMLKDKRNKTSWKCREW